MDLTKKIPCELHVHLIRLSEVLIENINKDSMDPLKSNLILSTGNMIPFAFSNVLEVIAKTCRKQYIILSIDKQYIKFDASINRPSILNTFFTKFWLRPMRVYSSVLPGLYMPSGLSFGSTRGIGREYAIQI